MSTVTSSPWAAAPRDRRLGRARALVLVWLATTVCTSLVLPGTGLLEEQRPRWVALGAVGIAVFAVASAGAVHGAVTPWTPPRTRRAWIAALVVASVASLALVAPVAAGRWATWAWVGAGIVGVAPLLVTWRWVVVVASVCSAASVVVAGLVGGSPVQALVVTGGIGLSVAAVNWAPVWMWALLLDADAGRDARARLAAGEERLRFARDVHDLLGHSLTVIALKAELVARLPPGDPAVRGEAAQIQRLATTALGEVRQAVHAYRSVDLHEEVTAVRQVLESAGVRCTVVGQAADVPPDAAARLAPVLREAVTNVLRHSRATWCRVEVRLEAGTDGAPGGDATLTVRNDGVDARPADAHGSGLDGAAGRLADAGGRLRVERRGDEFWLRASVPAGTPARTGGDGP
ncbi:sensor histidine kinase [Cellulomonas wangsupingiae]|uniref:sensor histidine kinase n=1 Tax=Cellulomonas wangsupingiae TaxID=2968085 RepID=UPI001D0EDB50|nr:histidine kinase [Cellulomonas wangsupingiae]MCM0639495.1 histidine kinase [Cellulomonas wangsupingiae]